LHDFVRVLKVINREIGELESECGKRSKNALSVCGVRSHKDVDVTCVSGRTVESQGITTNNQILNLVIVQQCEQISEVGLYFHGIDGAEPRRRRSVQTANENARRTDHYSSSNQSAFAYL
jgi:hypothetical protein